MKGTCTGRLIIILRARNGMLLVALLFKIERDMYLPVHTYKLQYLVPRSASASERQEDDDDCEFL